MPLPHDTQHGLVSADMNEKDVKLLCNASSHTDEKAMANRLLLPPDWFNNKTMLYTSGYLSKSHVQAIGKPQHVPSRRFRVLAAPWYYAFVSN